MKTLIIDTETCGLKPPQKPASGVVEVACIEIDPITLEIKSEFYSRVNPGCPIDAGASKVHGIYYDDIINCPKLSDVLSFDSDITHIGHNVEFDYIFLKPVYRGDVTKLCTLNLARQYILDSKDHKLTTLVEHLNLGKFNAHNALSDCRMTLELLKHIVSVSGRGLKELTLVASKPKIIMRMPFGKYKGYKVKDLPMEYILYFNGKDISKDLRYTFDQILKIAK